MPEEASPHILSPLKDEIFWLLDRSDPLRPYNQKLMWAFTRWRLEQARVQRRAPAEAEAHPLEPRDRYRLLPTEGHIVKPQARTIQYLMRRYTWVRNVVEIGFNVGHSSYLFLSCRPDVRVLSFDLGDHRYVDVAKQTIDSIFPARHELITGDSRRTVPAFADENPSRTFDLIYIDGGHDYEVAKADIENCERLSTSRTLVVMDDLVPQEEWGVGPVRAWREAQAQGRVHERVLLENGFPLLGPSSEEDDVRRAGQIWGIGSYVDPPQPPGAPGLSLV
jgi:predicted O-methyltransferase YrrM